MHVHVFFTLNDLIKIFIFEKEILFPKTGFINHVNFLTIKEKKRKTCVGRKKKSILLCKRKDSFIYKICLDCDRNFERCIFYKSIIVIFVLSEEHTENLIRYRINWSRIIHHGVNSL